MRKILFIICWALAGVGLYSCSLDEPSYGKTTSDNFYQKESDIEQALTGAYLQLRTTWNEYALNHYFVGDCSTDDALKGGGNDGDRAEPSRRGTTCSACSGSTPARSAFRATVR